MVLENTPTKSQPEEQVPDWLKKLRVIFSQLAIIAGCGVSLAMGTMVPYIAPELLSLTGTILQISTSILFGVWVLNSIITSIFEPQPDREEPEHAPRWIKLVDRGLTPIWVFAAGVCVFVFGTRVAYIWPDVLQYQDVASWIGIAILIAVVVSRSFLYWLSKTEPNT